MKLTDIVYWVGSGEFGLSHYKDCHVYLLHDGSHSVLIDSGCGIDITELRHNIEQVTPLSSVTDLFLTHGHGDHSGGASALQSFAGFRIHASESVISPPPPCPSCAENRRSKGILP